MLSTSVVPCQYQASHDAAAQALALAPTDTRAHFRCGEALGRLGRHAEALAAYDQALACYQEGQRTPRAVLEQCRLEAQTAAAAASPFAAATPVAAAPPAEPNDKLSRLKSMMAAKKSTGTSVSAPQDAPVPAVAADATPAAPAAPVMAAAEAAPVAAAATPEDRKAAMLAKLKRASSMTPKQ